MDNTAPNGDATAASEAEKFLASLRQLDVDEVQRLHQQTQEKLMRASDFVYVELALLKDLRLGAAMALRQRELAELLPPDELARRVASYAKRYFDDIPHYFPSLKLSNQEIDAYLHNPAHADLIFLASLPTSFGDTLTTQLLVNANNARALGKFTTKLDEAGRPQRFHIPITLLVNTYPLRLSPHCIDILGRYMAQRYGVVATITCQSPAELPLELLLKQGEWYLYHWREFLERDDLHRCFLDGRLLDTMIFAARHLGPSLRHDLHPARAADVIASALDMLSMFKFIPADKMTVQLTQPERSLTPLPEEPEEGDE